MDEKTLRNISSGAMIAVLVMSLLSVLDEGFKDWAGLWYVILMGACACVMSVTWVLATKEDAREWKWHRWIMPLAYPVIFTVVMYFVILKM